MSESVPKPPEPESVKQPDETYKQRMARMLRELNELIEKAKARAAERRKKEDEFRL